MSCDDPDKHMSDLICWQFISEDINPYNAEIFLYKPWSFFYNMRSS